MVVEVKLKLRLCSPLAIHQSRSGTQYIKTLDYIPGTALRGALAETYLLRQGKSDETFFTLFLSDKVRYGDLWPTLGNEASVLIPATAQACKRSKLEHRKSFRDTLLDTLGAGNGNERCPECEETYDRVSGYFADSSSTNTLVNRNRLRISTAIARCTGTVAPEMLFTQHTLHGVQYKGNNKQEIFFQGTILLADASLKDELGQLLSEGKRFSLGAGRSRGLGEVIVESWQECAAKNNLVERWKRFNETAWHTGGEEKNFYFSLTLLSHLALRDEFLRPVLGNITPSHLGLPEGVEWVRYPSRRPVNFFNAVTIAGWNAAQGLPKPDTVALSRGSVLFLQCNQEQEQALLNRLTQIEAEGLGERKEEGFGRIAVCYPIHYERWRGESETGS